MIQYMTRPSTLTRHTVRTLLGSVSTLCVVCACASSRPPTEPFDASLPPSALTDLFGGQTGSDESTSPCEQKPASYEASEPTPLGVSGETAAQALTQAVVLQAANETKAATLDVSAINLTELEVLEPDADNDECRLRLHVFATARLETEDGSFESTFPVHLIATSAQAIAAMSTEPILDPGLFADQLDTNEALRVVVSRDETWHGWVTVYDPETRTERALAELSTEE